MANASYSIHLAAAALGLGSEWVSILPAIEPDLKTILGVPQVFRIYTIIPIGYPAYEPPPGFRRDISEILHYDKYDMSKFRSDEQVIEFIVDPRTRSALSYRALV